MAPQPNERQQPAAAQLWSLGGIMKSRISQILLFVAVLVGWTQTATAEISAPLRQMLDTDFDAIVSIEKLPADVRKLLPAGMVNPNEGFDATDVVTGKASRRLIVAGHSSKCDFVCYEHGGYGYHLHLVIFSDENRVAHRIFEGRILKDAKDAATVSEIKALIRIGDVPDETKECEKHPSY
jgi:hypothetical protein